MHPKLSVVVIIHKMRREAPRTLFSLSPSYQPDVEAADYEVIVIENGSTDPLPADEVERIAPNFRYHWHKTSSASPVGAVDLCVDMARGERLAICIDGARILSPGVIHSMLMAFRAFANPFVYTLGWHLGEEAQNIFITKGYNQLTDNLLLNSVDWRGNGYTLFPSRRWPCRARRMVLPDYREQLLRALQDRVFALGRILRKISDTGPRPREFGLFCPRLYRS